ncbi:VOC family protein [Altericroceibacterium endophyticum]|uniref:VOC domain-containing protein n=1 Tax=Altericroceibacterium endophyticum TaxID=1808508 RepID=A0A6I4T7N0_9SPHN|nr:VOC family protein [Altericroceibacterium endophyticum]MXO66847.1 hypothetical protein [Altericroceibacterium endophyticum]
MSASAIRLSFFKLNTANMEAALRFYGDGFGFAITATFDEPDFIEHIMALPGQQTGPSLLLVEWKDARDVSVGGGHGPVGFEVDDLDAVYQRLLELGATGTVEPFDMEGTKVAMLTDPEGHEIELIQLAKN